LTPKKQFEKTLTIPSLCPHASRYHSPRSVRELARKVAEAEGMTERGDEGKIMHYYLERR
jgi:hypothetical protein